MLAIIDAGELSVDERGAANRTPLHRAAGANHIACCKALVEAGADLNKRDKCGRAPLHWASMQGNTKTAEYLIKSGADIFAENDKKYTSLHNSAEEGKEETVKVILEGASNDKIRLCNKENIDTKKAADLAKDNGHKSVLKVLKEGGDPNAKGGGCLIS